MNEKIEELQDYMRLENVDMVYLDDPTTVAYFTGFESDPHERIVAYIALQRDHFLFVPSIEKLSALEHSHIEKVFAYNDTENPWSIIAKKATEIAGKVFDFRVDEKTITVERNTKLLHAFLDTHTPSKSVSSDDIGAIVDQMRVVKTADEIDKMLVAGELADEALQIGMDYLKEGITEQEVVFKIEMEMKKRGVSEMSFSTMVLFGDNAASPHGKPGNRQLKQNEFVLFDLGVIYDGYASDVTRTIVFGTVDERKQEIYKVVLDAQRTAQEAVKPGMRAGELDEIARKVITDAGYGEYFTHRLGHGIGKTAHEFPSIHGLNDTILEPGMCFSLEPGIYIQDDVGIRIEDCVYVTENGCVPFTTMDKELTTIIR